MIVIVVHLLDHAAQGEQRQDIRQYHHRVEAVCHVPYKVNLRK